jgi:hypothetical protein
VLSGVMAALTVDEGYAESSLKMPELFNGDDGFRSECMRCSLRVHWSG